MRAGRYLDRFVHDRPHANACGGEVTTFVEGHTHGEEQGEGEGTLLGVGQCGDARKQRLGPT